MDKLKSKVALIVGLFFIVFGTFTLDYVVYRDQPDWTLWICYVGLILIGLGILIKSPKLVISQLYILTVPVLIWLMDFFYTFITGNVLWGVTGYFFASDLLPAARIISLQHFFVLPLACFALCLIWDKQKKIRGAWLISVSQIAIIFLLTIFFTNDKQNVNCVFRSCFPYVPSDAWYPLRWLAITWGSVFVVKVLFDFYLLLIRRFKKY